MSTEVLTSPSVHEHRSRIWLVAAAALVVGLAAGAAIVAITQTDSSTSSRASSPAAQVTAVNATCTGDGGALFTAVSAMPTTEAGRVVRELSPPTRALLRSTARASAATSTMPATPDPAALAAVFSRVRAEDATTIMSGFPHETRAAIGSIPTSPQACS